MNKKIAIFDFDGTLVPSETIPFMAKVWKKHGYSKTRRMKVAGRIYLDYMRYKTGVDKNFRKEEFRRKIMDVFLHIFKNMNRDEVEAFFYKTSVEIMDNLNEAVVEELRKVQREGATTILLSGGYTPLVENVGEALGFDHVIASNINYNGEYIDYDNPVKANMGDNKLKSIEDFLKKEKYNLQISSAYADSYYDYPILNMVGRAVAVNPDEELKKIAIKKNWDII